ncbi:MAG TPA: hypothetical protein VE912_19915, partial [Bacteroidales bacterium]|nr:hypothetical protein [Bacteroidales bacterium]
MKYNYYIFFILLLTGFYRISGQESDIKIQNRPTGSSYMENLRLITDRDIYVAGERIWFSTILQCNRENPAGCLSNILYVDLYRESGPFRLQQKFRISEGRTSGSLIIPNDFITGNYYIQVYTNFQKSALPPDLTRKEILILNPSQKISAPEEDKTVKLFFDGGKSVSGYPATGVVVINQAARIMQTGILINSRKDTICRINKLNDHLGIFSFTPFGDSSYMLNINFEAHDSVLIPLEASASSGIRLSVQDIDNNITVEIIPQNRQLDTSATFYVRDQQMKVLMQQVIPAGNSPYKLQIPSGLMAPGINYLVLKDSDGKLLSMHSYRSPHGKYVTIELNTDKKQYKPGETVKLILSEINEKAQLVVSTAIKGSIETNNEKHSGDTILEAARIIRENEILHDKKLISGLTEEPEFLSPDNLPDIRDVSITGIVSNPATGHPLSGSEIYLSVLGDEPQLHIYKANDNGSFIFSLDNYQGNKKIFAGTKGTTPASILINSDFLPEYQPPVKLLHFKASNNKLYEKIFINQQVAQYFLSSRALKKAPRFIPQPILSQPDYTIVLDDFIPMRSLEEVFKEIVPNTYLTKKKGDYHFQLKTPGQIKIIDDPLVLLDNIPVFDYKQLLEIPPSIVEKINIINQEYFFGVHKLNGIINVITNKSALGKYNFP